MVEVRHAGRAATARIVWVPRSPTKSGVQCRPGARRRCRVRGLWLVRRARASRCKAYLRTQSLWSHRFAFERLDEDRTATTAHARHTLPFSPSEGIRMSVALVEDQLLDSGTLTFTVEGRILRELGERLVKQPEVALVELIKNSY